jgi:hypothetical protein
MAAMSHARLPWWLKITAKVVLSQLPVSYEQWRGVGLFKHGAMLDAGYAVEVFNRHFQSAAPSLPQGFAVLELGPGDSLATAVIAAARGAGSVYLVDAGRFASVDDVSSYNALAADLASRGWPVPGAPFATVTDMLAKTNAQYLTAGVRSLASIPQQSIDFVFSQAVLEHVALDEFDATLMALQAVQKPGALCSHRIDLQDHLAHSLHSLRFSPKIWESQLFTSSGFYTNRLRASQILERFTRAHYEILSHTADRWPAVPLPTAKLHPMFAAMGEDELRVRSLDVVARRPG